MNCKLPSNLQTLRIACCICEAVSFGASANEGSLEFPPECPVEGTLEVVADPAAWADRCFMALTGRLPTGGKSGDSYSIRRDIDLDGNPEILEARGTGRSKQIYVFKDDESGATYIGMLTAHPSFYVAIDEHGRQLILNIRRMGADDVYLDEIEYKDRKFVVVDSTPMQ